MEACDPVGVRDKMVAEINDNVFFSHCVFIFNEVFLMKV